MPKPRSAVRRSKRLQNQKKPPFQGERSPQTKRSTQTKRWTQRKRSTQTKPRTASKRPTQGKKSKQGNRTELTQFSAHDIQLGIQQLNRNITFMRKLHLKHPSLHMPLDRASIETIIEQNPTQVKYLGLEDKKPRFSFADTVELRIFPRSKDSSTKGLRRTTNSYEIERLLPSIYKDLNNNKFKSLCNDAVTHDSFETSQFAKRISCARTASLQTGVPVNISLEVLKERVRVLSIASFRNEPVRLGSCAAVLIFEQRLHVLQTRSFASAKGNGEQEGARVVECTFEAMHQILK